MQAERKIGVQCLYNTDKRLIKPTSKGFKRTKEGKVYYHCLLRDDCVTQIGCYGKIFLTPDEQAKFLLEELEKMPIL